MFMVMLRDSVDDSCSFEIPTDSLNCLKTTNVSEDSETFSERQCLKMLKKRKLLGKVYIFSIAAEIVI
jgi:hypothetical protein